MDGIGELLREEREARGITLQQVSDATKIRVKYLEAIECGEYGVIPGEVYLKGFIRNYADCIGLDGGQVLAKYSELRHDRENAALRQLERERAGRSERSKRDARERRAKARARIIGLVALIGLAAAGLYYVGRAFGLFARGV